MKDRKSSFSRYIRQIILPKFGQEAQQKLQRVKVLVVGVGGLGSVVSLYLACSGIGYIGLVDPDTVELSNLQRQILHSEEHIGMLKVVSGMINLRRLNSDLRVLIYPEEINNSNVLDIIKPYDIVVACPDNFKTRFILNDVCLQMGKPFVIGAVSEFEGHVFSVLSPNGPCYRCLFNEAKDENLQRGIFAPVVGVIGAIQASETLKLILNIGDFLYGRMLIYDAFQESFREVRFKRDSSCKLCK
ncbi:MAG: HesA/MoeB/ThiF family protein [Thermodesulfovibrionaceae bacterium]